MQQITVLDKVSKISLYLLVFLVPLWFLPITQDILNFQKQLLLIFLVSVSAISWLAKSIMQKELDIRISWIHLAVLGLLLVVSISTLTSVWRQGSFWGWPFNSSDAFITILFFAIFYFLVSHIVRDIKELVQIFYFFILSSIVVGIYAIFQSYGIFIIPLASTKVSTFNTVGSINSVAILMAIILPLSLMLFFAFKDHAKWVFFATTILLFIILLVINVASAWMILIAGLVVLLTFKTWHSEFKWISLPMILLITALFILVFKFYIPGSPVAQFEAYPSMGAELHILKNTVMQHSAFGTGPGTFVFNYSKYHQASLNQTAFFATKFHYGASEILDWFVAKGMLGGLAFLMLIVTAIAVSLRMLLKRTSDNFYWILTVGILSSFVGMVFAQSMYHSHFTLSFLFWLLLGGLGAFTAQFQKKITIAPNSFLAVAFSFIFLLAFIFGVGVLFIASQNYIAEMQYLKGVNLVYSNDINGGITNILSAATLNQKQDLYWRDLAQLYIIQFNQIVSDKDLSEDVKKQKNQAVLDNAVAASNQAIFINPINVENWNMRGFVYRNFIGINGADDVAIEAYHKAISLEPNSPFSYTELGRVYIAKVQAQANNNDLAGNQQDLLGKALEYLQKALELKPDYAPAHYLIALVYDQQGKSDEAIRRLEELKIVAPNDIGLAFQLGVLYYQRNNFNKAQVELERAKSLNPHYSNARYMLGLVYDKQGKKDKSIAEFTEVLKLNPDNAQVKKILENLRNNKPALTEIQTLQPPIQENASER